MSSKYCKILACLLALILMAGIFTGCYRLKMPASTAYVPGTAPTKATTPSTTAPAFTTIPTTAPVVTQPPTTLPPTTVPPTTVPPTTVPPTTVEPTTKPTTKPATTAPTTTVPAPSEPNIPSVDLPDISAKYAFVYDLRSEELLYANAELSQSVYPASITKLFTTYVALQYLDPKDTITVGTELNYVEWDASVAGFQKGDCVRVEDLVYGALLPSGCDASYILATAAGRKILGAPHAGAKTAIKAFLTECNRIAKAQGMENTNITSPDGYHKDDHYISLQAMTVIGRLALENECIAQVVATAKYTMTFTNADGESCSKLLQNTNKILQKTSKYYHSLAVGLKTGTTTEAGACLIAAYKVEGGYILVGILGCEDNNARFSDANALFDAFYPYI